MPTANATAPSAGSLRWSSAHQHMSKSSMRARRCHVRSSVFQPDCESGSATAAKTCSNPRRTSAGELAETERGACLGAQSGLARVPKMALLSSTGMLWRRLGCKVLDASAARK
jgi:hypothetical protein